MLFYLLLFIGGLFAGSLGGLLGIGGGIILMPILRFWVGLPPAYAAGTCVLAVFFTTLGGSYRHYRLRHVDFRSLWPVIPAGIAATILFSILFRFLAARGSWLDLGIGLVFSLIAARMVIEGMIGPDRMNFGSGTNGRARGTTAKKIVIGAMAGLFPGLFGIGTGVILVPSFTWLLGTPVRIAMGSSLACFSFNAFVSSLFKLSQGFVEWGVAIPICAGALIGANIGSLINQRFPSRGLKLIFGVLFLYVASRFILLSLGIRNP